MDVDERFVGVIIGWRRDGSTPGKGIRRFIHNLGHEKAYILGKKDRIEATKNTIISEESNKEVAAAAAIDEIP